MRAGEALEQLRSAIDAIRSVDADETSATGFGDALEELAALRHRIDHEAHRLLRRFEIRGDHTVLGYRTPAQWMCDRLRCSKNEAHRTVRLARDLASMPTVAARWADGEVGAEAARLVASARTVDNDASFTEWEPWLAEQATRLDHRRLSTVVRTWKLRADPDSDDASRAERDRDAHVSTTFRGTVVVDGVLSAVNGAAFSHEFDRLVDALFQADWTAATERLGSEPTLDDLDRTAAQRRADALVEMAHRSAAADVPPGRRPRPLITVVTSPEALTDGLSELWNGHPLTSAQLADLLRDDPDIERFTYGGNGVPLRHDPQRRFYTGRLRRAIEVRDRRCTGRGCDVPASRCQVDHIVPWASGGRTTPVNGRLACGPCNRARPSRCFAGDPDPP